MFHIFWSIQKFRNVFGFNEPEFRIINIQRISGKHFKNKIAAITLYIRNLVFYFDLTCQLTRLNIDEAHSAIVKHIHCIINYTCISDWWIVKVQIETFRRFTAIWYNKASIPRTGSFSAGNVKFIINVLYAVNPFVTVIIKFRRFIIFFKFIRRSVYCFCAVFCNGINTGFRTAFTAAWWKQ